ncbi:hypothetical protein [Enterococcus faecalis]|nr:hypothetical protein [Enterococcus faecalis]ARV05016.1 hypothetical protein A6B47_14015 [Enterococcus faecalis]MBG9437193.1 hypothetical protein [Enterococcus faecalis]MBG9442749.1 hypothetical protein [Enterococcus faecalis]MDL4860299.1 hypothetical protein [Enterococcus faecalis]MDL4911901.1 hypothetical protein [Enterococcus faecalis]
MHEDFTQLKKNYSDLYLLQQYSQNMIDLIYHEGTELSKINQDIRVSMEGSSMYVVAFRRARERRQPADYLTLFKLLDLDLEYAKKNDIGQIHDFECRIKSAIIGSSDLMGMDKKLDEFILDKKKRIENNV